MKLPTESKEWHKKWDGCWERTFRCKNKNVKGGSWVVHWTYYEIYCEYCGGIAIARKSEIDRGKGKFCSYRCVGKSQKHKSGQLARNWKGGRFINGSGYVRLLKPDHPNANKLGYVLEHILVMSEEICRPIGKEEVVHHINDNRQDNRIENLQLLLRSEHTSYHHKLRRANES